ncbi:MAG: WecB/TagA/CpsF family glycosyltransferase [Thermoleophilia bacterium]|jgi:exopolysaccharide biosynthesis WecB/TagA/CpsF family protein
MRILLPTMRDPGQIGGTSTHIAMLSQGLREVDHEVKALYLGETVAAPLRKAGLIWPAGLLNRIRTGWGMVYAAEARGRLLAARTAEECAHAYDAGRPWDALNAQEVYSVPYLRPVADEYGIPLVLTLHGYPLYESVSEGYSTASSMGLNYLMRAEMQALRLADAVVTVDGRLYRHALRLVPERAARIYTLMNFIDTSTFVPLEDPQEEMCLRIELRKAWGVPEGRIVLLCPRRLVKKNGVIFPSLALAAMEPAQRGRFLLLHAGEGGERREMEDIIRTHALEPNVRLLGGQGRDAILELYRLADIVLVPSVHSDNVEEATSLSALEAMASGRPLIAGDVGGLAEMVVDGETGLLVSADPEALAAAILRLAADPELAARLAAAARDYVVKNHSHLRAAAAYAEVYSRAICGRAPQAGAGIAADPLSDAQPAFSPTPAWPSLSVLGFTLDVVTLEQAVHWVIQAAATSRDGGAAPADAAPPAGRSAPRTGTRLVVSFNPELVMRAQRDPQAAEALLTADLCYPDGVGAVWAAGRQGARLSSEGQCGPASPPERVAGVDLAQRVLESAAAKGLSIFFLGAAPGVAEEAARRQAERCPGLRVAGTHHGYFTASEEGDVVDLVRESAADILLVALGAPRQEILLHKYRDVWGAAVGLGVGGSFDVWAGIVERAPSWTQKAKIEWLYRLVTDPRRARRQLALPRYASRVVRWSADDYGPPRRGRARDHGRSRT